MTEAAVTGDAETNQPGPCPRTLQQIRLPPQEGLVPTLGTSKGVCGGMSEVDGLPSWRRKGKAAAQDPPGNLAGPGPHRLVVLMIPETE